MLWCCIIFAGVLWQFVSYLVVLQLYKTKQHYIFTSLVNVDVVLQ